MEEAGVAGPGLSVMKSVSDLLSAAESVSVRAGVEFTRLLVLQSSNYNKHGYKCTYYMFIVTGNKESFTLMGQSDD